MQRFLAEAEQKHSEKAFVDIGPDKALTCRMPPNGYYRAFIASLLCQQKTSLSCLQTMHLQTQVTASCMSSETCSKDLELLLVLSL